MSTTARAASNATPNVAPGGARDPDPATVDARAAAAARQVATLTDRYVELSAATAEAADRLQAAFTASSRIDRLREADAVRLRATRVTHAATVRALYADGRAALAMSVLGSADLDDAMWRVTTLDRLQDDLARRATLDLSAAGVRATRSALAAEAAAVAEQQLAAALRAVQDDEAAAQEALSRARTALARLDAQARRLAAARAAADRLSAAETARRAGRSGPTGSRTGTALAVPARFERLYRQAATSCTGMDWTLLAAVGQVESGHGRANGPSSAGAVGPMQFMPSTFRAYAVDGDRDGRTDPWAPADAIWTAAHYLCDTGARGGTPAGVRRALFAYNHAQWYVDLVLGAQSAIAAGAAAGGGVG